MNTNSNNALLLVLLGIFIFLGFFVLLVRGLYTTDFSDEITSRMIKVSGIPLVVEVADTNAEHKKGLSGREELTTGTGMLFIFEREGAYDIWMKDMNFPIDVLWLDGEGVVVGIKEFLTPSTYPNTYRSSEPAKYILEVAPGFVEIYSIQIGDIVTL